MAQRLLLRAAAGIRGRTLQWSLLPNKMAAVTSTTTASFSTNPQQAEPQREIVQVLKLNNLRDNPGARKQKRRVGRGTGSGRGKTCGRGHKGQKSRSGGGVRPGFEGGQTPLYKLFPKRGFKNKNHGTPMVPINVGTLQDYIDMKRLIPPGPDDPPLNLKDLVDAGMTKTNAIKHGVKLLSDGADRLKTPIRIDVSRASTRAIDAIESVGGEVTTVHYNKLALRALLKPHKFHALPRFALPPPKLMEYYTNWKHRGYLSPQAQMRKLLKGRPDLQDKIDAKMLTAVETEGDAETSKTTPSDI